MRVADPIIDAPDGAVLTFSDGLIYERQGHEWVPINSGCTGVTATWCPLHGDCTCPPGEDGLPTLDADGCPLHDALGPHGIWYEL